jgi:hypothetical protein
MSIQIIGSGGTVLDTDTNKNVLVTPGLPKKNTGYFTMYGNSTTACVASLAADVTLAWIYNLGKGNGKISIKNLKLMITIISTQTTSGRVPGALVLQRFKYLALYPTTVASPSGSPLSLIQSNMISQFSNADIVMTNAVYGSIVAWFRPPHYITGTELHHVINHESTYPTVLQPYDGLALRVSVAFPLTQTWNYAFFFDWSEE